MRLSALLGHYRGPQRMGAMNRRSLLTGAAALMAAGVSPNKASAVPPPANDRDNPNIIFILMDNLGYGEPGVYGGGVTRGAPTPRIDQLAAEGMRLTNFNVEAQCTPSRSAIMTGRHPIRSGTQSIPIGGGLEGLTQWEVTIAETLSAVGYATAMFGNWHLGSEQGRLPNDQGFDEWYGIPRTTDESLWPSDAQAKAAGVPLMHVMEGRKGEKSRELTVYDLEQRRLIDAECTRRAIDFMKRSASSGTPFYLYIPYTLVHFPTLPNPKFAGKTGYGDFPDALAEMDASAIFSIQSMRSASVTTPSSCSQVTTGPRRRGPGRERPDRGAATTSPTWKAPCACHSSYAGPAAYRLDA